MSFQLFGTAPTQSYSQAVQRHAAEKAGNYGNDEWEIE